MIARAEYLGAKFYNKKGKHIRSLRDAHYFIVFYDKHKYDGRFFSNELFKKFDGKFYFPKGLSVKDKRKFLYRYGKVILRDISKILVLREKIIRKNEYGETLYSISKEKLLKRPKKIRKILATRGGYRYIVHDLRYNFKTPSKKYIKYIDYYKIKHHLGIRTDSRHVYALNLDLKKPFIFDEYTIEDFRDFFKRVLLPHLVAFSKMMPTNRSMSYSFTLKTKAYNERDQRIISVNAVHGKTRKPTEIAMKVGDGGMSSYTMYLAYNNSKKDFIRLLIKKIIQDIFEDYRTRRNRCIVDALSNYMSTGFISYYQVTGLVLKFNYKRKIEL